MSAPFPEPALTPSSILGADRRLIHCLEDQPKRLGEMLLDRALGDPHMFGDLSLRKVLKLLQLERLSTFWRQHLQYFVQTRQFFLSAEPSVNAQLLIDDVQRIQIRYKIDRNDTRAAEMLADDMARSDEEICTCIADDIGIGAPEACVSFLD